MNKEFISIVCYHSSVTILIIITYAACLQLAPWIDPRLNSATKIVQLLLDYFLSEPLSVLVQLPSCPGGSKPVECPHTLKSPAYRQE